MKTVDLLYVFPTVKDFSALHQEACWGVSVLNHGVSNYSRETFLGALDLGRQTLMTELGMHPYKAKRAEAL